MGECILMKKGGGVGSDDLTATRNQVLSGFTYMGADTDDDAGVGAIPIKAGATHRASIAQQTLVNAGTYCSGAQVLAPVTHNISPSDIRKGAVARINNGASDIIAVPGTYAPSNKAVMLGIASWNNTQAASFQYTCTGEGVIYCLYDIHSNILVNGAPVTTANVNNNEGLKSGTNYMVQNMSRQAAHEGRYPFRFQPIKAGDVVSIIKDRLDAESQIENWAAVGVMAVVVYD